MTSMLLFGLTTFLSAFLLFNIQPLMGHYILPWFGGTPAVWTSCMLFFQVGLLAGYAYAFGLSRQSGKVQRSVHLVLLAGSLAMLPIDPRDQLFILGQVGSPALQIPLLLAATIGLPFVLVSATAPLLQHWFAERFDNASPYRLYALSNTGSILALISYPLIWEPFFKLEGQTAIWSVLFLVFASGCGLLAYRRPEYSQESETALKESRIPLNYRATKEQALTPWHILTWLVFPALGSTLLLASTNQICQEVASVPFLWVLPLALYLFSFILTFESERWYIRWLWGGLMVVLTPLGWYSLYHGVTFSFLAQLLTFCGLLFVGCMLCHGELYRLRPGNRHLTLFYLCLAAGGACGGMFVSVVAPALFTGYREFEIALVGICLLTLLAWMIERAVVISFRQPLFWIAPLLGAYVLASPVVALRLPELKQDKVVEQLRNFYGILAVVEKDSPTGEIRTMVHGRINHGSQYTARDKRHQTVTYYAPGSPVDLIFKQLRSEPVSTETNGLKVGIVGTGAGSFAAFGQAGDTFRFYEINPQVIDLAYRYFSFLTDTPATVDVILGDGRIMLERELDKNGPHNFDLLAIDAFSGDAIPMHLITLESFRLYLHHLADDGLLLYHVTNRFVDLVPVVEGLAAELGYRTARLEANSDPSVGRYRSIWMAVTRNEQHLAELRRQPIYAPVSAPPTPLVFTDNYSSLLKVLNL
ncbi:MAG: ferrichrome ABC transporter permease [Desulfuromonas sp.]|nr:MAG: ferrichrome ABC transporter permease [Desulfuromonas sp.]